jgi:hypothetical protein
MVSLNRSLIQVFQILQSYYIINNIDGNNNNKNNIINISDVNGDVILFVMLLYKILFK